ELELELELALEGVGGEVLVLVVHHIATDGWSMGPLARDLAAAYAARCAGRVPRWEPLAVQYADYTVWQQGLLGAEEDPDSVISAQLEGWSRRLAGLPAELELPWDRPRPAVASHRGGRVLFEWDRRVHQGVVEVAASVGATPFMVVQAALAVLLTRLGAGEDIPLGTPVAGRMDEAADDLVGFFTNTLVLRTDTSGNPTFGELLQRVRQWDLDAYTQQDVPFERLVEVLNPARSMARHPLFQVMLAFNNVEQAAVDLPGLSVQAEPVDLAVTKFDLSLSISEAHDAGGPAGLQGAWEYSSDLLDPGTAERMLNRLHHIIHTVIANPDQRIGDIDILQPEERTRLLTEYNDTRHPLPQATVPELFQAQAALTPDAIAVTDG
ncbi:condensation domain-containing protein, partial [Streptomyces chartreusis]|uniref:condensation domain-containing protein n=1 Tax=Streptomyces chartreusis TaxID=1969 RepID=UPI0033A46A93